ncbi:P27 family phage terminase small subunit [Georgenia wangjunii]|uniref:P27 family phage terminase small subunit n=1 Tax=Georgenia wangjunii TaxID=3117730 RepID=UPI002F25F535
MWQEIVESNDLAGRVDRAALETFASLVARLREARQRINDEGMVVEDKRGRVMPHPALLVERQTAELIRAWGDRFAPLVKPARKRGYMADATASAIANAQHLQGEAGKKFAGAVAAAKTLAWLIDEAQRDSLDALMKAASSSGIVPSYLKVCAELQITPAAVPSVKGRAASSPQPAAGSAKKGRRARFEALQGGAGAATGS